MSRGDDGRVAGFLGEGRQPSLEPPRERMDQNTARLNSASHCTRGSSPTSVFMFVREDGAELLCRPLLPAVRQNQRGRNQPTVIGVTQRSLVNSAVLHRCVVTKTIGLHGPDQEDGSTARVHRRCTQRAESAAKRTSRCGSIQAPPCLVNRVPTTDGLRDPRP